MHLVAFFPPASAPTNAGSNAICNCAFAITCWLSHARDSLVSSSSSEMKCRAASMGQLVQEAKQLLPPTFVWEASSLCPAHSHAAPPLIIMLVVIITATHDWCVVLSRWCPSVPHCQAQQPTQQASLSLPAELLCWQISGPSNRLHLLKLLLKLPRKLPSPRRPTRKPRMGLHTAVSSG